MKISKKKHLEIAIESIPTNQSPKVKWEQYYTPSTIAADILWNAHTLGDVFNKSIIDLGCGTGIFTLSSVILGAKIAIGIDIDSESIAIAQNTVKSMEIDNSYFFVKDIHDIDNINDIGEYILPDDDLRFDTLFMNPPFGSQSRSKKGADRAFMELAMKSSDTIYSFHMAKTKDFVEDFYKKLGGKVTHRFFYNFPLCNSYDFHTEELKYIEVMALRVENKI